MAQDRVHLLPVLLMLCMVACGDKARNSGAPPPSPADTTKEQETLLRLLPAAESGIDFANKIYETNKDHLGTFHYIYNGNGVAVGDVNGDSLPDIYITGNYESDHLYLNKGGLHFEDVTTRAGLSNAVGWKTGVCMVDIDTDGDLDIYVCRSWSHDDPEKRRNLLYINNGILRSRRRRRPGGSMIRDTASRRPSAIWTVTMIWTCM
jgi:hypothetical protein